MMKTIIIAQVLFAHLWPFVAAGVVSTANGGVCGSCAGSCGQLPDSSSRRRSCACDVHCIALDDCCYDFPDVCPKIFANATTKDFYPNTRGRCHQVLVRENSHTYNYHKFTFISTCPTNETACGYSSGSPQERLASMLPVMDNATRISFSNAACAVCNGVKTAVPWPINFLCSRKESLTSGNNVVNGTATVNYLETLMQTCDQYTSPPTGAILHQCMRKVDDCPSDNETLQERCYSPFQQLTKSGQTSRIVYHNPACAECHNKTGRCGHPDIADAKISPLGSYSLAVLVDFTYDKGLVVGQKYCAGNEVWSDIHMSCVPLVCRYGYEPLDGECVSSLVEGYLNFTLHLTLVVKDTQYKLNMSESRTWEEIVQNASSIIELDLHNGTSLVNWTVTGRMMGFVESAHSVYSVCLLTYKYIYNKNEYTLKVDEDKYHQNALDTFQRTFEELVVNQTDFHMSLLFAVALGDLLDSGESRGYDCHRHLLQQDRFLIKDEILVVHGLGREYLPFEYVIDDNGDALVCTYSAEFTSLRFTSALGIFTIVCLSVSLFCLAVRLFLHLILPIYHTFPMRLQALMCLSMFFAFLGFLLMPSLEKYFYPCYIMGIATHFGFLSFYCWLGAISAYTWVSFLPSSSFIKSSQRDARLWPRMLFAWGLPLIIVIAAVVVDQMSPNYDVRPGYGLFRCWFNRKMPQLIFFVVPLACIVVVNLFFFVSTVFHLQQGFKDCTSAVRKGKVKQFRLFAKLFVIMGLTEILSFISPFVDVLWLWYLYIGLNGTMGLFIFWAFVLTKPVIKDAKSWWKSNVSKTDSSTFTSSGSKTDQTRSTTSK